MAKRTPDQHDDDGLEALFASGSVRIPADASELDALPPYDPRTVEAGPRVPGSRPVPPAEVPPAGEVPDTGRGVPLDLSKDPDRVPAAGPVPPDTGRGVPLDLSQDPDRFGNDHLGDARFDDGAGWGLQGPAQPAFELPPAPGPLDPRHDPDRFRPVRPGAGAGETLQDLLGEGAQEEPRDGIEWLVGLLAVVLFLGLVALVFSHVGP